LSIGFLSGNINDFHKVFIFSQLINAYKGPL